MPLDGQSRISSFFSSPSALKAERKRGQLSPIDLTNDSDSEEQEQPPNKKRKSTPTSNPQRWSFNPSQPAQTTATNVAHQERFKTLLDLKPEPAESAMDIDAAAVSDENGEASDSDFKRLTQAFGKSSKPKKIETKGPGGQAYTPLENQVRKFQKANPDAVLMIQVGYRYFFYGKDAEIAAKELGVESYMNKTNNFLVAFIPIQRRDIHLKKLLSQGHKVGIVDQIETAAIKKASKGTGTFERKLTQLIIAATYVDEVNSADETNATDASSIVCIHEKTNSRGRGTVIISLIAVTPASADVVYDEFEDSPMRLELETRVSHLNPARLLLPKTGTSLATEKMLAHFSIPIERTGDDFSYTEAFDHLTEFYSNSTQGGANSISIISGMSKTLVKTLSHTVKYLSDFGVSKALLYANSFTPFSRNMILSAKTLSNLEIFRNETDGKATGSLFSILNRTKTAFGGRTIASWIAKPLTDASALESRVDAVEEILSSSSHAADVLNKLLKGCPDLPKCLSRIQYGKCSPKELSLFFKALRRISTSIPRKKDEDLFKSPLLNDIVSHICQMDVACDLLNRISLNLADENRKDFWKDRTQYDSITKLDEKLDKVEARLNAELESIRKQTKTPKLKFFEVGTHNYLIELPKRSKVPDSWETHSSTGANKRYITPEVQKLVNEKSLYGERLAAESATIYSLFLEEIVSKYYGVFRAGISKLATLDCLLSLAVVASQQGYVKPQFTSDTNSLSIVDGRHPVIEVLRLDPYVPNSINMGDGEPRHKVIAGPNMGGKSSSVRMVALIVIMAQIGSYVPAKAVTLGMHDMILTRMGGSDDLIRGRSTFMVELTETSEILARATPASLVLIDELGRGTSTFDGMAIAESVLQHLVQSVGCKTLFITHYLSVAREMEKRFPSLQNMHTSYRENTRIDGTRDITFLYKLVPGIPSGSYGIECAKLAGISDSLLQTAAKKSQELRRKVEHNTKLNKLRLLNRCLASDTNALEQLSRLLSPH